MRGRALEVLAGEGGVERERVPAAPGSVVFGSRGNHGERARQCPLVSARIVGTGLSVARGDTVSPSERVRRSDFDSGCGHGSTDGERAHAQLDSAVEAWRAAQDSVARSVSSTGSANLDVVASAGSFLLRVSPLAVVLKPKFRIIYDLTFTRAGGHSCVNDDTDFSSAPSCELGHVLRDVLLRVLLLRQKHGLTARIVLCRVDVKDAFRQVLADPVGAPVFGYAMGEYVVADLRLQFGWRKSPGLWGLMASSLEHVHTHSAFQDDSSFQDAAVFLQGAPRAAAVEHVRLAPPRGG